MKKFNFLSGLVLGFLLSSIFFIAGARFFPDGARLLFSGAERQSPGGAVHFREAQDPFAQLAEMEKQASGAFAGGFAGAFGGDDGITVSEDEKYVSYEIAGIDATTLSTSVKDGYLTIEGETKTTSGGATFQSSFRRAFSLPENVNVSKMETLSEKDKVILRFPKRR